jgi:hypothetical protein
MDILHPITNTLYSDKVNGVLGQVGDMIGKRIGGGRAQFGLMTFADVADVIVRNAKGDTGFDKQAKKPWQGKSAALKRVFAEYGWPAFEKAILIGVVRKWIVDEADGFIPLACGSIDIEAGLNILADLHKECLVSGIPSDPDPVFAEAISKKVGVTTEYGNGDSFEIVVPQYTAGIWEEIRDTEFGRPAGAIIVTPHLTLYCEGMTVNNLWSAPTELLSVKTVEAIKIAKQLCRECRECNIA